MNAVYVEFELESATMNTREFYASRQGTHRFFTKEAVACSITYSEALMRSKADEWAPLSFRFSCTPAMPIRVFTLDTVYKAGDNPNVGLLRYGRQELLMPGSSFRFIAWGEVPDLKAGQIFLIGKKRAAARITTCVHEHVHPSKGRNDFQSMPIQVSPIKVMQYGAFTPIAITARYAVIKVAITDDTPCLIINDWAVPLEI